MALPPAPRAPGRCHRIWYALIAERAAPRWGGTCPQCARRCHGNRVAAATLTPPATSPIPPMDEAETRLASDPWRLRRATGGRSARSAGSRRPVGPRYRILRCWAAQAAWAWSINAWDEESGVAAAPKVIRPEVSADPITAKEPREAVQAELLLARQGHTI